MFRSIPSVSSTVRAFTQQTRGMKFARLTSFKVGSVEDGHALDSVIQASREKLKTMNGFVGSQRLLCGQHLDYTILAEFDSVEGLVGFEKDPIFVALMEEIAASKLAQLDTLKAQNFMHEKEFL
eukprot:m.54578 g.54578  ORF g.54578 m.54578 type:complete len:124 (+) comp21936_c0_seq1:126-497(+)